MRADQLRRLTWNVKQLHRHTLVLVRQNQGMPRDVRDSLNMALGALDDAEYVLGHHLGGELVAEELAE